MNSQHNNLSSMARSKLTLSSYGKDSCSLHRWVLLKNSIVRSTPQPAPPTVTITSVTSNNTVNCMDEESVCLDDEESDSFLFPSADKFVHHTDLDPANGSEADWLNSLLESLDDDEEHISVAPEDEESCLTPPLSPMSSSDDLTESMFYSPSPCVYSYPYPVPYPPFQPSLSRAFKDQEDECFEDGCPSVMSSDALPYCDLRDVDELSVPDAIEDDSDNESDIPSTPILTDSSGSSLSVDPTSIPLPPEEHDHHLRVYVTSQDDFYNPFDLLPFSEHMRPSFDVHQEC